MGKRRATEMLKFRIVQVLVVASLWGGSVFAVSGGDFYVTLDKIDNQPELSREFADWHLYLRRINKKEKVVDGYYTIKKDIHDPKVVLTSYILSNNKFYKMAVNELAVTNLCSVKLKKDFIDRFLVGNSSFSVPPDCVIRPGHMKMRKAESFDSLAHRLVNKTLYGTYKIMGKIVNKDNQTVGGGTWVVTAKKRD